MYISRKYLIIIGALISVLLLLCVYFAFSKYSFINLINQKESNSKNEAVKVEIVKKENEDNKDKQTLVEENNKVIDNEKIKNNNANKQTTNTSGSNSKKKDIISYLNNLDNTVFKEENIKKFGSKAKETFIKITDFVFYGTTLNGVTFNGLKDDVKLKVMNLVLKIDSKIEKIYPGYKTEIKLKVSNLKEKIAIKYLEVSSKICDSVGEESCNEAKKGFKNMKESFGLTFDFLKIIGKNGLESLKGWYEVFRES